MIDQKTLASVLKTIEGSQIHKAVLAKGESPFLDTLDNPEHAMKFLRTSLCGSRLFAQHAVPAFAAAVFGSLRDFPPVDDTMGPVIERIVETVRGEVYNNNIFQRQGECHAHYHDMLEAYAAAGGDMDEVAEFARIERSYGFFQAVKQSPLWSNNAERYAIAMYRCCEDPLAMFILMPANEEMAPRVYERALKSLCREPRFDKFRTFLERHVAIDTDDHGPVVLDWLDLYLRRKRLEVFEVRKSAQRALRFVTGGREPA